MKFKLIKDIIANSTFEDVLLYEKGTIFIPNEDGLFEFKGMDGNIKYQKEIKPYKILFMNDNYYLTAEVNNDYKYSMFRINNISNVNIENYEFEFDYDLLDFIINIQTPFAKYQENYKEII
jgi:hypothetical protein